MKSLWNQELCKDQALWSLTALPPGGRIVRGPVPKNLHYQGEGVWVAVEIKKICGIFILTIDIENPLHRFEDIHQQIFLAKFHENPTLPGKEAEAGGGREGREGGGVDSTFQSANLLAVELNQHPSVTLDFHETLQGASTGGYLQINK